ncbi:MAG: GIY-YIG nuclease family protein [Rhodospirillaceae bacterium]|nr:GIY-YIG nuclease family protein [Rhodospirillaceae bacterium]
MRVQVWQLTKLYLFIICTLMRKGGYVYILGSLSRVLYVGVTADLARRLHEHRTSAVKGFTTRYNIWRLLWCEPHDDILGAIAREKQIKRWRRKKKLSLIAQSTPEFRDLWPLFNR